MWIFRVIRLFAKSLSRIAVALEELRDLYKLDMTSRGLTLPQPGVHDEVEVMYGYQEPVEEEP